MFKKLYKGLSLVGLMFFCLTSFAFVEDDFTSCNGEDDFMDFACDITVGPVVSPTLVCDVSTPLTFTLTNNLPVSVPYTFTLTGDTGPITVDPATTCGATELAPGICFLVLDLAPACPPAGDLIFTVTIKPDTTQPPIVIVVDSPVTATTPQNILNSAGNCEILAGADITNSGPSLVAGGDICLSPGTSVTGFAGTDGGPGILVGGSFEINNGTAATAQVDLTNAITYLTSQPCSGPVLGPTNLAGSTLTAGVYCFSSSAQISTGGTLTLNGTASDLFIFLVGSSLTINNGAKIVLTGGAQAGNVYFVEYASATIGTGVAMQGNIIARTGSISMGAGSSLIGRALASTPGAVTLITNAITVP